MKASLFLLATILACSAAANGYLVYQNTRANFLKDIETKRGSINEDMTNELLWGKINEQQQNQMELARIQGYNEGIQSLVHKIDPQQSQISQIWHQGYQRGLEQSNFMEELGYEKGYSRGLDKGREEYMKAINNIITGSDDVRTAIREFAQKSNAEKDGIKPENKPSK